MSVGIYPEDLGPEVVTFDAIESEEHTTEIELTEHAVEVGTDIADHARPKLKEFTCVGLISNTPIKASATRGRIASITGPIPRYFPPISALPGYLTRIANDPSLSGIFGQPIVTAQLLVFDTWFDAIRETWEALEDLQKQAKPCRIVTSLREYENMVLLSMLVPRAQDAGTVAAFNLHFKEVRIVESGTVVAPPVPVEPRGANAQNKGAQGGKGADEQASSAAWKIKESVSGFAGYLLG